MTDRGWWLMPALIAVWIVAIAAAAVELGVWAAVAVWLGFPVLVAAWFVVAGAVARTRDLKLASIQRHPSSTPYRNNGHRRTVESRWKDGG